MTTKPHDALFRSTFSQPEHAAGELRHLLTKWGGNLAETLANLSHVLRMRGQMKLKIKAMSSESKASAYIIGALPFIVFAMIWFINGTYMQNFFIDQRLMAIGMGGMVWMAIGAFIMSKMISFEI